MIAEANVDEVVSLRAAFRRGRRAFLLNPPGDTSTDTDIAERRSVSNIFAALEGSGLEKVVTQSTGGAQPGDFRLPRVGLEVNHRLRGLHSQPASHGDNGASWGHGAG